jgi:hypothetical protein
MSGEADSYFFAETLVEESLAGDGGISGNVVLCC